MSILPGFFCLHELAVKHIYSLARWVTKMILLLSEIEKNEMKSTICGETIWWYVSTMNITKKAVSKWPAAGQGLQITKWPAVELFSNNSRNLWVFINWKSPIYIKNHC